MGKKACLLPLAVLALLIPESMRVTGVASEMWSGASRAAPQWAEAKLDLVGVQEQLV